MTRLGDIGVIITGNTPKTSEIENYASKDICFIKPSDFLEDEINNLNTSEFYISKKARDKARLVPSGTILVTCIGIIGKVGITTIECAFNQQINAIIPDTKKCNPKYLAYVIAHKKPLLQAIANAPVVPIINKSQFSNISINVPSLETQGRIVQVLDKLSRVISTRKQQLSALDDLIKARFVEIFGDPILNEKGFDTKVGADVFKLSNGKFVPENKRLESGIPVYGGNGVSWYTDDTLFEGNTVVVGRVGFQSGNVHLAEGPLWISDNAMYISDFYDDGYDLRFLYWLMEHIDFTRFQDAGDLKKITQKPFLQMRYIKPPISMQHDYNIFVAQIDKSKAAIQKSLDETQLLFDSLMQKYFE